MLTSDTKKFSKLTVGEKAISALYRGATLVWQAVSSCFGGGLWVSKQPWSDKDAWKY
jgi:hypothetical protein